MADTYLLDAMKRIVAMQKEALDTLTSSAVDAVYIWPYAQESFPYFTNRLAATDHAELSQDIFQKRRSVLMRLVAGHFTEGYATDIQNTLYDYIPTVEDYFMEHPWLTTDAGSYTSVPDYLFEETIITADSGVVIFVNAGIGVNQLGIEWTLTMPYLRQAY